MSYLKKKIQILSAFSELPLEQEITNSNDRKISLT